MTELNELWKTYKKAGLPEQKFRKLADLAEGAGRYRELKNLVNTRKGECLAQIDRYEHSRPEQAEFWGQRLAVVRRELNILEGG